MEPILREHLLALAAAYGAARGLKPSTIGKNAISDGQFFGGLAAGRNFTVRKYDQLVTWFAANWPADLAWPSDIPRPAASPCAAAASGAESPSPAPEAVQPIEASP